MAPIFKYSKKTQRRLLSFDMIKRNVWTKNNFLSQFCCTQIREMTWNSIITKVLDSRFSQRKSYSIREMERKNIKRSRVFLNIQKSIAKYDVNVYLMWRWQKIQKNKKQNKTKLLQYLKSCNLSTIASQLLFRLWNYH